MSIPRLISCDEAGFTGNDLLNADQPYFAFASIDLSIKEGQELVDQIRRDNPSLQGPELKSSSLLSTERGQRIVLDLLKHIRGRYMVSIDHKMLVLACKFFEYIYEPVLQSNNKLFYDHNLHRFVAMFIFMQIVTSEKDALTIVTEFSGFMRTFDPSVAPSLFAPHGETDELLDTIIRFANGYQHLIHRETEDIKSMYDGGRWILDMSLHNLFSHLAMWSKRHAVLEVDCDPSKPLKAAAPELNGMIGQTDIVDMELFGKEQRLTWNMSRPIAFVDSKEQPCIQIADIVAGAMNKIVLRKGDPVFKSMAIELVPHIMNDGIMPDYEFIDITKEHAVVNMLVLHELAHRADNGLDPLCGMHVYYQTLKESVPFMMSELNIAARNCST